MANSSSNQFKQILSAPLFGDASGAGGGTAESLTQLTAQLLQLQTVSQAEVESTQANTQALQQVSIPQASTNSGSSTLGSIGSTIENIFGFGFGLSPIISGIASLFGGGGSSAPPPLTPYVAPGKVQVSAGVSDSFPGQAFGVDYGQGNTPRPVESSSAPASSAQITVQVQALDSQSFLDHSADIAAAVRQAMLESSVLTDVLAGV
jgi:hypothetical protein